MKFFVGVTNNKWFKFLSDLKPDEVNFCGLVVSSFTLFSWSTISFKLHSPDNYVAGGGFFVSHSNLPLSLAGLVKEGPQESYDHDSEKQDGNAPYEPFFFERSEWIPAPSDWEGPL